MSAKPSEDSTPLNPAESSEETERAQDQEPSVKRGVFAFPDGSQYDGEYDFVEGKIMRHGHGRLKHGPESYVGEWQYDKMHGAGVYHFATKARYEGDFDRDSLHGNGLYKWPDGSSYRGSWHANKMHGTGVYTDKDGVQWKGEFFNGKYDTGRIFHILR